MYYYLGEPQREHVKARKNTQNLYTDLFIEKINKILVICINMRDFTCYFYMTLLRLSDTIKCVELCYTISIMFFIHCVYTCTYYTTRYRYRKYEQKPWKILVYDCK